MGGKESAAEEQSDMASNRREGRKIYNPSADALTAAAEKDL